MTHVSRSHGELIVPLTSAHWPAVKTIYAAGIETGHATFEANPPTWETFDATRLPEHRLVCVNTATDVVGWAATVAVSNRLVYAGIVEHSVYVHPDAQGQGVGRRLLDSLIESTEGASIWTLQCDIFPENSASLALHEVAGFRTVGVRERVGQMTYGPMRGQWRDVVFMERRSGRAAA
jgi:phosphinothricin acetyltransferase